MGSDLHLDHRHADLVRKGWVEQLPDSTDLRRKLVHVTAEGQALWGRLPDVGAIINARAFTGISEADLAIAVRVLRTATERLATVNAKDHRL